MDNTDILINLTNHPSEHWDDRQRIAAMKYGKIIDIPFPDVDPNGDEEYIGQLCKEYYAKVMEYAKTCHVTVHLMGEFSFTFALLKLLQPLGIDCIVSTTRRMVSEVPEESKKEVTFEFVRFRRYT